MSADLAALLLIIAAAPAQTAFPIYYGLTTRWWETFIGRALMTKATGLALLIDISIAYHFLGDDYALRDIVRITVLALIAVGAWMQLLAFLCVRRHRKR